MWANKNLTSFDLLQTQNLDFRPIYNEFVEGKEFLFIFHS